MYNREKTISQYTNSPKFQGWLNSFSDRCLEVCDAYRTLEMFFDIDTASGKWLDLLGVIIGQPRPALDSLYTHYFAFNNTEPLTGGFGVGKFWGGEPIVDGNTLVDDIVYRKLLKARAFKNTANTSMEDILAAVFLLTGHKDCRIIDGGLGDVSSVSPNTMQFALEFTTPLDDDDKLLILSLDLLPRPAGVELTAVLP